MKAQFQKLTNAIAKSDACTAELQRHRDLLKAAEEKREKLVASGEVENPKTRSAIADCDLDCRMLPHRIRQYGDQREALEKVTSESGRELEVAVADEVIRLQELLNTKGVAKVMEQLKPLGLLRGDVLADAGHYYLSRVTWGGQLAAIVQNTRGIPARSALGNAEPLFALAEAIEKFCK